MAFLEDFLKISTWQSLLFVLSIIVAIIIIFIVKRNTKSWTKTMLVATVCGLVIAILFSALNNWNGIEHHAGEESNVGEELHTGEESHVWREEIAFWGDLLGKVFYNATSIILPFVLFSSIVVSILKYRFDPSKRVIRKGFLNVFLVFMIGIGITVIVSLLFFVIDLSSLFNSSFDVGSLGSPIPLGERLVNFIPSSISDFFNIVPARGGSVVEVHNHGGASVGGIISAVIAGLVFGLVVSKMGQNNKNSSMFNSIERGLLGFNKIMNNIMGLVIGYLPVAILGFITTGIFEGGISQIISGGVFIGFMFLTLLLIWIVLTIINYFLTKNINRKKAVKELFPVLVTAFFTQSSQATLPLTRSTLKRELGVKPLIADAIPTFVASGLSIACTGAFPLLSSLVIANNLGTLDVLFYVQAIIIVTILAFGMAGVPGDAAVASTNVARSLFTNNASALSILGIILSTDLISEMARTATNVYGAITASLLTNHQQRKKKSKIFFKRSTQ